MIQRIQSVYLFFVCCLMALLIFIPFTTEMYYFFSGLFSATALTALVTIFLYKKRNLQIKLCYAILLMQGSAYLLFFILNRPTFPLTEYFQNLKLTFIIPVIAIILVFWAIRKIKNDEKLVRSLDRLR